MNERVIAIDPGSEKSAVIVYDGETIGHAEIAPNGELIATLSSWASGGSVLAIEQIRGYGLTIGNETLDTVFWTGRFAQAFGIEHTFLLPRKTIVTHLCNTSKAGDSAVRAALLDRFGGKERAIGTKRAPGPLYGIASHLWAALAVSVTYWDQRHYLQQLQIMQQLAATR